MSDEIALRATGLGKRFKIYRSPWHRMREWFSIRRRSYHSPFWAVKDVSFEVRKGEFFGIIGVNGAGENHSVENALCYSEPDRGQLSA